MNSTNRNYVIGGVAIIAVLTIGGYLFWQGKSLRPQDTNAGIPQGTSTSVTVSASGTGQYTVTQLPDQTIPAPVNYKAPLTFSTNIGADAETALKVQFAQVQKILAADITNFDAWINLGTIRKIAGDYQGAATDWAYAAKLYPKSQVPFDDLGGLYLDFIKDYPKAEANYLQALKNEPGDMTAYESLYSLYTTYGYKADTTAALDLLNRGIAANPKSVQLQLMLARYYKAKGETSQANAAYDAAIANAQAQGQAQLATQIQQEKTGQ